MSGRKIDERPVSIPEVKDIMDNIKEQMEKIDADEGMSHFQEITYNFVNKFVKMETIIAKKIIKFLMDKHGIEELFAINVVNIDPQSVSELRSILEKSFTGKALSEEQLEILLEELEDVKTS